MNREKKKCECFIETKKYLNKRNQGRKRTVRVCACMCVRALHCCDKILERNGNTGKPDVSWI